MLTVHSLTETAETDDLLNQLDAVSEPDNAYYRFTLADEHGTPYPEGGHAVITADAIGIAWNADPEWFFVPSDLTDPTAIIEAALNGDLLDY